MWQCGLGTPSTGVMYFVYWLLQLPLAITGIFIWLSPLAPILLVGSELIVEGMYDNYIDLIKNSALLTWAEEEPYTGLPTNPNPCVSQRFRIS